MKESQKEYKDLATIYDYLVAEIDYDEWFNYIMEILQKLNYHPDSVADLACGTGETTIPFAKRGIGSYGIDISEEMLEIAEEKRENTENIEGKINFLQQDMKELNLPELVDLVVCYHDGMNYILSLPALRQVFERVYDNLVQGGYFIFDLNTVARFQIAEQEEGITIIDEEERFLAWQTDYDDAADIWRIDLTGFIEVEPGLYRRFQETHREKHYSEGEVIDALRKTGFDIHGYYENFTWQQPDHNSSRIVYVVQKA